MKDSGDSHQPRRVRGGALVALAAVSLYAGDSPWAGWTSTTRAGFCYTVAGIWLLLYALLAPTTLSYALMLDLRRRGRLWTEAADQAPRPLSELHERARWVDLSLPCLLTMLLFCAAWLILRGQAALDEATTLSRGLVWATVAALLTLGPARWLGSRGGDLLDGPLGGLTAGAVEVLRWFLVPVARVFEAVLLDRRAAPVGETLPAEELADVIEVGSHQGDLTILQSEMLRRELDFARKTAADVMVPRVEVEYVDVTDDFETARARVVASRYSRFPVKADSVDKVVAVLQAKQLLRFVADERPATVGELLAVVDAPAPLHVPQTAPLEEVLEALRQRKVSLAIVDDDFGGVAGILTVEDVVEELVGEIVDESDREPVREVLQISARRTLAELAELGIDLPGDDDETLGDFLAARLGDELVEGREWATAGRRFIVDELDGDGRIETVRAELSLSGEEAGP